jgi:hypothetical protein
MTGDMTEAMTGYMTGAMTEQEMVAQMEAAIRFCIYKNFSSGSLDTVSPPVSVTPKRVSVK